MSALHIMLRLLLLCSGIGGLLCGCLLLLYGLLWIGINDAEWGNITRTGLPSHPDLMTWSAWHPNDGSVWPFPTYNPQERPPALPEYRVAQGHTLLFDYTFYQGRYRQNGIGKIFPAIGSDSGTSYHPLWAMLAFLFGMTSLYFRSRRTTAPRRAISAAVAGPA